jgi:hypothetical protein
VTLVADSKAETRPVQTGLSNGKVVALKSGVNEGDQVIILSSRPVRDGQPVGRAGAGKAAAGVATAGPRQHRKEALDDEHRPNLGHAAGRGHHADRGARAAGRGVFYAAARGSAAQRVAARRSPW